MDAVFAAPARPPITAALILFELTGEYTIILPLMTAVVLATLTSRLLTPDTIYTLKLSRRGVDLHASHRARRLRALPVGDAIERLPATIPVTASLSTAAALLAQSPHGALPLNDADGHYRGVVTARAVATALEADPDLETGPATAADLATCPPPLTSSATLASALHTLAAAETPGIAVLDDTGTHAIGWLTHQSVLTALHPPHPAHQPPPSTRSRAAPLHATPPGHALAKPQEVT